MAFTIHQANDSKFFVNSSKGDIVFGLNDSNSRILMGNSNTTSTMEIDSHGAIVNGSMIATHMSSTSLNSSQIYFCLPSNGGILNSNYAMPGSLADAAWSSNMWSSNGIFNVRSSNLFSVSTDMKVSSNIAVNGVTTLSNTTLMVGDTSTLGKASFSNAVSMASNLTILGETNLFNTVKLYGPVNATGNVCFESNVEIRGSLNARTLNYNYSNVTIYSSEEIRSNLNVLGTISGSNLGIGTINPTYPLHVLSANGGVSIFASHDITAFSDRRAKTDLRVIENALDKVRAISGYTFARIPEASLEGTDPSRRSCGLIAQELYEVLPEAVHTDPSSGMMTVAYGNVISLIVNALKELEDRVISMEVQ